MIQNLSVEAIRVLGVLIEKELSTPEYYPMTLNSLKTGCNQKSNRNPVVTFSESDVVRALDELELHRLVGHVSGAGSRSIKYRHAATQAMDLSSGEVAVLACLFLRGAQTPGEIKGRTGRLFEFSSLAELETTLEALIQREEPFVRSITRKAGQKEDRFVHLIGSVSVEEEETQAPRESSHTEITNNSSDLREEVRLLRDEVARLREEFEIFRRQFE